MGYYNKSSDYSLPNLAQLDSLSGAGKNLDSFISAFFGTGAVFGTTWNGSSWLITGQLSYGSQNVGAVISLSGGKFLNLTSKFYGYFKDGGAWIDGWNGTAWLVAGNNDNRASLVEYLNGSVTNLTPFLGYLPHGSWIQFLLWNGSAWFIGGHEIFGFLEGDHFVNELNASPFAKSGALSATFTRGEWIIGGGPPAKLLIVKGTSIVENLTPQSYLNDWVNGLVYYDGYLLAGGKGVDSSGLIHPALVAYSLRDGNFRSFNLSGDLATSFDGGQIQFMANVSFDGKNFVLVAGQGDYNPISGYSIGALEEIYS